VVRSVLKKRIAVDPFDRLEFELSVEPKSAWIKGAGEEEGSPEALALCRAADGYEAL
jgi:hypothetical protein